MRHALTIRALAAEFASSKGHIQECIEHSVSALFTDLVAVYFSNTAIPHSGYQTGCVAGVGLVVDSTFWPLPRLTDSDERSLYYHMKSPTKMALKWQLCVTIRGVPWHMSNVVVGSKADITLLRESGVLSRLPPDARILGDKGYVGEAQVITPKKKPRWRELKKEEKKDNKTKNSRRAVVENTFHIFKTWAIVNDVYRGEFREEHHKKKLTEIVHVFGAMVKM